jgi:hypothetical protein
MFIPPAHSDPTAAPRLLSGPRNVTAAAGVPAIRERIFHEPRRQGVRDQPDTSAPAGVPTGSEPAALDPAARQAAEAATYAYLSDSQGRLYLVDASAIAGVGMAPGPASAKQAVASGVSAHAERALNSYASAAKGFPPSPPRLSIYV